MMKNLTYLYTLLLLFVSSFAIGQVTISRQVIGATGGYSEGSNITISSTVGETVMQSHFSTNTILTQGFQQTEDSVVTYEVINESCSGGNNGSIFINDVKGCAAPYTVSVMALNTTTVLDEKALGAGTYTVEITGANGCTYSATITVGLDSEDDCTLKFYSGFSPNGDGLNDAWVIDNIELHPENKVQIFNRWGEVVWSGENYNNDDVVWNGLNKNGNEMTAATYFYVAEVSGQTYKGWVEITR
ncbi:MAG: gliding motility-associated C-terminal domain-containing protein [Vicingaceae bacterium]